MNPEIRDEWTAALRSGDYSQGKRVLRNTADGFCCLGVLCDIAVKHGVIPEPERRVRPYAEPRPDGGMPDYFIFGTVPDDPGEDSYSIPYTSYTQLPVAVRDWAGLDNGDPIVSMPYPEGDDTDDEWRRELSALNDEGMPFVKIADLIEGNL